MWQNMEVQQVNVNKGDLLRKSDASLTRGTWVVPFKLVHGKCQDLLP